MSEGKRVLWVIEYRERDIPPAKWKLDRHAFITRKEARDDAADGSQYLETRVVKYTPGEEGG